MAFIIHSPFGRREPIILNTTNDVVSQIWNELALIRHTKSNYIKGKKSIPPWIDQAKIYFTDAISSNWRSSGLLFYYSYLNLAKALLVGKGLFSYKQLNTNSIYHGLSAELQDIKSLTDYIIKIHPKKLRHYDNVFANLYTTTTNKSWPFRNSIEIKLSEILQFCISISSEIFEIYKIPPVCAFVQSLIRIDKSFIWYEILSDNYYVKSIINLLNKFLIEVVPRNKFLEIDKYDWLLAYNRNTRSLRASSFIRTKKIKYNNKNKDQIIKKLSDNIVLKLKSFSFPCVNSINENSKWIILPKIELNKKILNWHPILSDYLFSFALSSILRYQPQLLKTNTYNSFITESWCQQSSITLLKYFLMIFTYPPKIVKSYR
ncbi:MAG: YaaC family protein [Candidatus Thorarchaeota archaeon]